MHSGMKSRTLLRTRCLSDVFLSGGHLLDGESLGKELKRVLVVDRGQYHAVVTSIPIHWSCHSIFIGQLE